jgi:hypothetical protein
MGARMITFDEMYNKLIEKGEGRVVSSKGTEYRIEARDGMIIAYPRSGDVRIHKDCWGENTTCKGTRAGGIYNGPYSIFDWYRDNL